MKSNVNIAALIILLAGTGWGMAAEPVTGAFGIKLGDVLSNSNVLKKTVLSSGVVKYEIKGISQHKSFQVYDVEVTAGSKKIHTINGAGRYPGMDSAMKEFNAVKAELESKYGPAKTNRREGAAYFPSEKKTISLLVNQERASVVYLNLACKDDELVPLAEKEVPPPPPPEEIEGAFGIKFGQVFDPATTLGKVTSSSGEVLYALKVPTPNPFFELYFVEITPKTKRIFQIWAQGKVPSLAEGKVRQDSLAKTLEAKYQTKRGLLDSDFARLLMQGEKTITVKTSRQLDGSFMLDLKYLDQKIKDEGRKEAVDGDVKNVNTKGL